MVAALLGLGAASSLSAACSSPQTQGVTSEPGERVVEAPPAALYGGPPQPELIIAEPDIIEDDVDQDAIDKDAVDPDAVDPDAVDEDAVDPNNLTTPVNREVVPRPMYGLPPGPRDPLGPR